MLHKTSYNWDTTDLTFAFFWVRLSEDSLKVMEGLWDLPDVLGEMSWWGLLASQLQLLSLWRTPRGSLRKQGGADCAIVVRTYWKKSNSETMSHSSKSSETKEQAQTLRLMGLFMLTGTHRLKDVWTTLLMVILCKHASITYKPFQGRVVQGCGRTPRSLSPSSLRYTPYRA